MRTRRLRAVAAGLVLALVPAAAPAQTVPTSRDDDLYTGSDPNRNLRDHQPFRIVEYPTALDPRTLGIRVTPTAIELVQGGALLRTLPFPGAGPVAFERIAAVIDDPAWIFTVSPGVFGLRAALVQAPGTHVTFAQPGTRELRLASDPPGVFIGGRGPDTSARFDGVKVTSWDLAARRPSTDTASVRPFVLYE